MWKWKSARPTTSRNAGCAPVLMIACECEMLNTKPATRTWFLRTWGSPPLYKNLFSLKFETGSYFLTLGQIRFTSQHSGTSLPWVFRDTCPVLNCMVYRFYTRISWIPPYTLKIYFSLQKMRTCLLASFLPPPPPSHLGSEFHLVPLPLLPPSPLSSAWFNFTGRAHQCTSGESNLFPRFFSFSDAFFRKKRKEKALAKDCSLPRRCSQGFVVVRGPWCRNECRTPKNICVIEGLGTRFVKVSARQHARTHSTQSQLR